MENQAKGMLNGLVKEENLKMSLEDSGTQQMLSKNHAIVHF